MRTGGLRLIWSYPKRTEAPIARVPAVSDLRKSTEVLTRKWIRILVPKSGSHPDFGVRIQVLRFAIPVRYPGSLSWFSARFAVPVRYCSNGMGDHPGCVQAWAGSSSAPTRTATYDFRLLVSSALRVFYPLPLLPALEGEVQQRGL
jgi:hypothetical protein